MFPGGKIEFKKDGLKITICRPIPAVCGVVNPGGVVMSYF